MCNVEFMVMSSVYQKNLDEETKKANRERVQASAALAKSAERIRRSHEEEKLTEWFDVESRKVASALGTTKVQMAGAGVEIAVLTGQWAQAHVELLGARKATRQRQGEAGDIRAIEIEQIKRQRMAQYEESDTWGWILDIGSAFSRGVAMEAQITGEPWDGKLFGMNVGGWMGMTQKETIDPTARPVYHDAQPATSDQTEIGQPKDVGFGKPFFDSAASAPPAQVPDTTITPTYPPGYINPLTLLPYTVGYVPVR